MLPYILDLISKLKFWVLLIAVVYYVLKFFYPNLPFTEEGLLTFVLTVLAIFGIHAEVMYRRLVARLTARGLITMNELLGK